MKKNVKHILSAFAVAVFLFIAFGSDDEKKETGPPKTEREQKIESQFSAWDGSHRDLEKLIKKAMNDPDSYEHVETKYWDKGDHLIVMTTYRGKNAFGGVVKNFVKAKVDMDGNVIEIIDEGR